MEALARWVADEYRNKRGEEVDTAAWPRRYEADIPEQHNGWDCGVFTLQASPQTSDTTHPRGCCPSSAACSCWRIASQDPWSNSLASRAAASPPG